MSRVQALALSHSRSLYLSSVSFRLCYRVIIQNQTQKTSSHVYRIARSTNSWIWTLEKSVFSNRFKISVVYLRLIKTKLAFFEKKTWNKLKFFFLFNVRSKNLALRFLPQICVFSKQWVKGAVTLKFTTILRKLVKQ